MGGRSLQRADLGNAPGGEVGVLDRGKERGGLFSGRHDHEPRFSKRSFLPRG